MWGDRTQWCKELNGNNRIGRIILGGKAGQSEYKEGKIGLKLLLKKSYGNFMKIYNYRTIHIYIYTSEREERERENMY